MEIKLIFTMLIYAGLIAFSFAVVIAMIMLFCDNYLMPRDSINRKYSRKRISRNKPYSL